MFLGALLDAGLPLAALESALAGLAISNYKLLAAENRSNAIKATRLTVQTTADQPRRTWELIRQLIEQSSLADPVKKKSLAVFSTLAGAEAKVHGCPVADVHFHEVGAVDAIIDIVGTCAGLDYFGIDSLVSSPLPMPRGWVSCAHGELPIPAPAVCEILKGVPVYGSEMAQELVTPTGAALIKTLSKGFGEFPSMLMERVGYGAGSRTLPGDRPNLFRLVLGKTQAVAEAQQVQVIETNLDDWSPEGFPFLTEKLLALKALDVSLTPIQMKKGRPGFLLRVIAAPENTWDIKTAILSETTAIGLRFRSESRLTLPRQTGTVATPWGLVQVKLVQAPTGPVLYPEYEDCRRQAMESGTTLKEVYAAVGRCTPADFTPDAR